MRVKGADGHDYNVTGEGQGALNTVLGSLGTASFLGLNAGNILGGGCGAGWNRNGCNSCDTSVSRYEAGMMQEIAAKDGKIALLESNIYTDSKIADVYERLITRINADKDAQNAVNMQQVAYNATNTAAINCIQGQIAQLFGLTKLVIPNGSVCPGWGDVTVTPATTTTA
jgi:hypothetical protein